MDHGDELPSSYNKKSGKKRKSVSWNDEALEQVKLYQPEEPEKKNVIELSYPTSEEAKKDPMEVLEGEISAVCINVGSTSGGMDPVAAAAHRAHLRRHHNLSLFYDQETEEDSETYTADWDLPQPAEEGAGARGGKYYRHNNNDNDDDDNDEQRFNEVGVPIDPFNMSREREEGYFDESGDFVEWKREEEADSWIDSLPNAPVDPQWVAHLIRQGRHPQTLEEEEQHAAHSQTEEQKGMVSSSDLSRDQVQQLKLELVGLLQPGETVITALKRLGRCRDTVECTTSPIPSTSRVLSGPNRKSELGLREEGSQYRGGAQTQQKGGGGKMRAMPVAVKAQFDRLTDLSMSIMDAGIYLIHTTPRERLLASLNSSNNNNNNNNTTGDGREGDENDFELDHHLMLFPIHAQRSQDHAARNNDSDLPNATSQDGGEESRNIGVDLGNQLAGQLLESATQSNHDEQQQEQQREAFGEAVDATMDIFADDVADDAVKTERPALLQQQQSQEAQPMSPAPPPPPPPPPPPARLIQALPSSTETQDAEEDLDGFVLDTSSGYLYNTAIGCYYDTSTGLFGDAATGRWYSCDKLGQYVLVD